MFCKRRCRSPRASSRLLKLASVRRNLPDVAPSDSATAKRSTPRAALTLPPEIMLIVARFASDNDLERALHPERRWVPWPAWLSDGRATVVEVVTHTSPAPSVYESSSYAASSSVASTSDEGVDFGDHLSASSGAESGSQSPATPPFELECDPAWEGRSVQALSLVSRDWNSVTADCLFSVRPVLRWWQQNRLRANLCPAN